MPYPERVFAGGGGWFGQALKGGANAGCVIQEKGPGGLFNFNHSDRWNHAILASNRQNLLKKLSKNEV